MTDPTRPLPYYKVGGKVLVRVSEFDAWVAGHRQSHADVDRIVADVLREPT